MLHEQGLTYEEITTGNDATLRSVRAITGMDSVPQIFIEGQHIAGSEALAEYFKPRYKKAV